MQEIHILKIIRGLFIPEADCKWGSFDYASQEPRWLVHYCATLTGIDRHPQIDDVVALYKKGEARLSSDRSRYSWYTEETSEDS